MSAPPIGRPMSVRQSPRTKALVASPIKFTTRRITASRWPHSARLHKPQADRAHAVATVNIRAAAQAPMLSKATPALGLRRHNGSHALLGVRSATQVTPATTAPSAKNPLRATRPADGRDIMDPVGRGAAV